MTSTLLSSRQSRKAMGVTCSATIVGANAPLIAARCLDRVDELEQLWSRFIPHSDICRLNDNSGRTVHVDERTVSLIRHMMAGATSTHGAFNPALLPLQVHLGDTVSLIDDKISSVPDWANTHSSVLDIRILDEHNVVMPPGLALDAGGLGKGHAADIIVAEAIALGADAACVNLGGDMAISGPTPDGNGWTVEILDPLDLRTPIASVVVNKGGVATSSMSARRRGSKGIDRHILSTDAATSSTVARGATVLASTATWAEIWTKFAVLTPPERAVTVLDDMGLAALIVNGDGSVITTSTWEHFVP